MNNWQAVLKANPIDWLLGKDNPSVRYFALTKILGKDENDPEVKEAKEEIMKAGIVPQILALQASEGWWENPKRFYTAKYKGTVWQLIILAELGADGKDERIQKACEFILTISQDIESGGFSYTSSTKTGRGLHSGVISCLTGNMVWSLIRLGFLKDTRVQQAIRWITDYQRFDDGIEEAPVGWPYDKWGMCFGKHTCHMGIVKTLKALSEIPPATRSQDVKNTIEKAAEYLLVHHVYKRSHDLSRVSKPGWLRFGFPLMWGTDILEILRILTKLGYKDKRMQEAIDVVISKQDKDGRWKLANSFNGKFHMNIEEKGKPSKWVTLNAIDVLKRF